MHTSLTHRGRDKMAVIFQTTFCNAFSWMTLYEFGIKFYSCPYGPNWSFSNIGSDNGLAPTRQQAIIWTVMVSLQTHIWFTRPQWIKVCPDLLSLCHVACKRKAINWTNDDWFSIGISGKTNWVGYESHKNSFQESVCLLKCRSFCSGLNMVTKRIDIHYSVCRAIWIA